MSRAVLQKHRNMKGVSTVNIAAHRISSVSSKAQLSGGPSSDRLTPLDFDSFIPWICLEMQCPHEVAVKRQPIVEDYKEKLQKKRESRASVSQRKSESASPTQPPHEPALNTKSVIPDYDEVLVIKTFYNLRGNLVEVAIDGYRHQMSKKVLQALNICLPFHSSWIKLTVSKVKLDTSLMSEIAKMLPHSNLTDISFDGSFLAEANYYVLLDHISSLRRLSLKRCCINDLACRELASRLHFGKPASKSLLLLDLASNYITDDGAIYFGDALRMNRRLTHINLSDNAITDVGVAAILKHLMEFEVHFEEILAKKRRRRQYLEERKAVYESCLKDAVLYQNMSINSRSITYVASLSTGRSTTRSATTRSTTPMKTRSLKNLPRKRVANVPLPELSAPLRAEIMTQKIMGEFSDVFDATKVLKRDGRYYCLGNLVLCSINLSYTNLELPSLRKLCKVLKYQWEISSVSQLQETGLLRVLVEGTYTPNSCDELKDIDMYLKLKTEAKGPLRTASRYKV